MITLKFPSIDKALLKDVKGLSEDDPKRGIIVLDKYAIVHNRNFTFVINLYEYFTVECGITEADDLDELNAILFYMNGRCFNKEFWAELNKGANMKMQTGALYIENPKYSKDLHHNFADVNLLIPLDELLGASIQVENVVPVISLPFGSLKAIYDCMPADFKVDDIILEFASQSKIVKFTFKNRKHCFGFIEPNYQASQEGYRFHELEQMMEKETILSSLEEWREKMTIKNTVPPPPPTMQVVKDDDQQTMFDKDGQ